MDSKGYYKTLGVNEKATDDEIKKAFRKLSVKYHPDRNVGKSDAEKKASEEKFKEINEAYQVLSDPDKRREYDNPMGGGGFNFGDQFGFNFGGNGFNDLFNQMFGGRNNRRSNGNYGQSSYRQPVNGTDMRMFVQLSLEDIYNGCEKTLKYKRNVRCKTCHGSGGIGEKKMCPHCKGTGQVINESQTAFGLFREVTTCHHCDGTGYVFDKKCPTCNGTGFQQDEHVITVKFEPGIQNGTVLLKAGDGNESSDPKGNNGNCQVIVQYNYDTDKYQVQGLDVYEKIYIPYYDALLGCDYTLELPNGSKKKINIMTCMPNGKLLRLTGEGISNKGRTGDYYLEVNYTFPKSLDAEERKKLEDIKVIHYKKDNNL